MKAQYGKLLAALVIGVMFLTLAAPVAAQDGGWELHCNGLSEADCQILQDAAQAMHGVSALDVPAWSVNLTVDADSDTFSFVANGSARLVLPEQVLTLVEGISGAEDPTAAVMNWMQGLDAEQVVQILQGLGAYVQIDRLIAELPAIIDSPAQTWGISGEGIVKDGGLYLHLYAPNGADAWFGDQLRVNAAMMEELQAGLDEAMQSWQEAQAELENIDLDAVQAAIQPLVELLQKYVTTTREADTSLNGQTMFVFTTTFDVTGFLADEELAGVLLQSLQALAELDTSGEMGLGGLDVTEGQMQLLLMTAGLMVKESNFTTTVWVGADDSYIYREMTDIALMLDLTLFGEDAPPSVVVALQTAVEMDEFNTATMDGVTVPENYAALEDVEDFFPGLPEMIEHELAIGQTYNGALDGEDDTEDIFSLMLDAGQTVQIELNSEDYPYLSVYGPDGFQMAYFDTYYDTETTITAEESGQYLIVVEADWAMDYDLTVRAE